MPKLRILSGMRPTGKLHLGHLVGALENWVKLQETYECFYMIADWHALMSEYKNTSKIRNYAFDNIADWIACGIDPKQSVIFLQSEIKEHLELQFIFGALTPISWLERCPTYKEQLRELREQDVNTYAFLGYPTLQAADILVYKANAVPVGEDQLPHLELTREIARRFNYLYGTTRNMPTVFPEPEAVLTKIPRLLGLDRRKMSKSYNNVINLSDGPKVIEQKVQTMFTDPQRIKRTDPGHPEECNVFAYYEVFQPDLTSTITNECKKAKTGCTDCKKRLGSILIKKLSPLQTRRQSILQKPGYLKEIISSGNKRARDLAQKTMDEVRKAIAFNN